MLNSMDGSVELMVLWKKKGTDRKLDYWVKIVVGSKAVDEGSDGK